MDPRDAALQATCPVVTAPRYGTLSPIESGQRMVLADDGVYLQLHTPWLEVTTRVGRLAPGLKVPFGVVQESVRLAFGSIPRSLIESFLGFGRHALPNEAAGAVIYNAVSGELQLRMHGVRSASSVRIDYSIDPLGDAEYLVVDLHTHGTLRAFWSAADNRDDQGIKVCGVFGNLDQAVPTGKFRLALNGLFVPMQCPWDSGEQTKKGATAASA